MMIFKITILNSFFQHYNAKYLNGMHIRMQSYLGSDSVVTNENLILVSTPPDEKVGKSGQFKALLAGLGNPGADYSQTRHNLGFMLLDYLTSKWNVKLRFVSKFDVSFTTSYLAPYTIALISLSGIIVVGVWVPSDGGGKREIYIDWISKAIAIYEPKRKTS